MKSMILGVLTATLALTACSPQSSNPEVTSSYLPAPTESGSDMELAPSATAQAVADEVIGMSEAEAIEAIAGISSESLTPRIVRRDDENFMITMDYRLDRINLEIDNGIVTQASIG
jgi:protein-disulfide isomerase